MTQPEDEHKETWKHIDENQKEAFKSGPISQWPLGAGEMVRITMKMIKVSLSVVSRCCSTGDLNSI